MLRRIPGIDKLKARKLKYPEVVVASVFLCSIIYVAGFVANTSSSETSADSEDVSLFTKLQSPISIVFGFVGTAAFTFFINNYIDGTIRQEKQKIAVELKDKRRRSQEIEFLVGMDNLDVSFYELDCRRCCDEIKDLKQQSKNDVIAKINQYKKQIESRKEALKALEKGFTKDNKNNTPFLSIVRNACNKALGLPTEAKFAPEWAYDFYLDVNEYMQVWLTVSIKYGSPLSIIPYFAKDLGAINSKHYKKKQSYIEAIKYIQKHEMEKPEIRKYFSTQESVNIVTSYLGELIELFKENDFENEVKIINSENNKNQQ